METLRTIRVYGRLARFLGRRTFQAAVSSAAEAVRFLLANFPQLEAHMAQQHYRVSAGDYALDADELHHPSGQQVIRIVPVDRKSTRLNSSHVSESRMPSSA